MNIQLNTDKNIKGHERLATYVTATIESELARFSDHITRIEAHLSDENGRKEGPNDKRCMLEVRLEKRQPFAVTSHADTVEKALNDAIAKARASMSKIDSKIKSR